MKHSLFVKSTDVFTITLYTAAKPDGTLVADADSKAPILDTLQIDTHTIVCRMPNFKDNILAVDGSTEFLDGRFNFKASKLRMTRMIALIKEWTFTDEKGELVPVNETNIASLQPAVASVVGDEIEKIVGLF